MMETGKIVALGEIVHQKRLRILAQNFMDVAIVQVGVGIFVLVVLQNGMKTTSRNVVIQSATHCKMTQFHAIRRGVHFH